jgi:hypothetical protein
MHVPEFENFRTFNIANIYHLRNVFLSENTTQVNRKTCDTDTGLISNPLASASKTRVGRTKIWILKQIRRRSSAHEVHLKRQQLAST